MFERIKVKLNKGKDWVKDNKTELAYIVGLIVGGTAAVVSSSIVEKRDIQNTKNKYPGIYRVLSSGKLADTEFVGAGDDGPTVGELSNNLISYGVPKDDTVVGVLIYTKR